MNTTIRRLAVALLFAISAGFVSTGVVSAQDASNPPRAPRKDSFFGVHFDFHAESYDKEIGRRTTPEMVDALIDATRPDYFEIDTKGHPGYSSYPTKVGNSGGSFIGDPLRVWRDATARRGVALYGHHSSLWEKRACELHPEWQAIDAAGNPVAGIVSTVGPYADELFIPQLKELAVDYGLDGAWIDGDCWSLVRDWSPAMKEAFVKETGIEAIPSGPSDPNWREWSQFQREMFRRYVKRYIAEVKKVAPNFQFCSNWAFTQQVPEAPFEGIDFISGDVCGTNCVNVCRYSSRLMATQEVPWDLMSWSFAAWNLGTLDPPETRKTAIQLEREAACVIAQGGGYQAVFSQAPAGYPPVRDGSVDVQKVRLFGDVEKFCRERQEVCFQAKPIPQIALLLSTEGTYRRWDAAGAGLFWWDLWQQNGIGKCLVADRQAVSVLVTQRLLEHLDEYPLVVAFQWDYLEPELVERLTEYVKNGGRLYAVGTSAERLFADLLSQASSVRDGAAPEGRTLKFYTVGKGTVALTPQNNPPEEFVNATVREIFPDPIASIDGTPPLDLSLMRTTKGKIAVHLVNVSGPHETRDVIGDIPPVLGPITVRVRLAKKPKSIVQEPGARPVEWAYADGVATVSVESVPIHEIVAIEE